jgi:transcriptional regulator with XRE-family HTH domain
MKMKAFTFGFMKKTTKKQLNRIRVVLAEKDRTNKWLSEQIDVTPGTISKWCGNKMQPSLETLAELARILDVDIRELLNPTKI